jgi:hypothetical protein
MSFSRLLTVMCFITITTAATADSLFIKVRFEITEHGDFVGTKLSEAIGVIAGAVSAGCSAAGRADCAALGAATAALFQGLFTHSKNGNQHGGMYKAPPGYDICKVKIDWGNTGIDGHSTFAGLLERDKPPEQPAGGPNGLTYYAVVPTEVDVGTGVTSDLYFEYVPEGQLRPDCFGRKWLLWNCKGQDCPDKDPMSQAYGIYQPARYYAPPSQW